MATQLYEGNKKGKQGVSTQHKTTEQAVTHTNPCNKRKSSGNVGTSVESKKIKLGPRSSLTASLATSSSAVAATTVEGQSELGADKAQTTHLLHGHDDLMFGSNALFPPHQTMQQQQQSTGLTLYHILLRNYNNDGNNNDSLTRHPENLKRKRPSGKFFCQHTFIHPIVLLFFLTLFFLYYFLSAQPPSSLFNKLNHLLSNKLQAAAVLRRQQQVASLPSRINEMNDAVENSTNPQTFAVAAEVIHSVRTILQIIEPETEIDMRVFLASRKLKEKIAEL